MNTPDETRSAAIPAWAGGLATGHARSWASRVWRGLASEWCRHFHRPQHTVTGVDSLRAKVHCARCGRKFLLARRAV